MSHDFVKLALMLKAAYAADEDVLPTMQQQERQLGGTAVMEKPYTPPKKAYVCKECDAGMVKRGAGLGKWRCTKNSSHRGAKVL